MSKPSCPPESENKDRPPRNSLRAGLILGLFAVLVWGASFAVTRAAVQEIPPLNLALLRFALAFLILWPAALRYKGERKLNPRDRVAVFWLAFLGITLYFAFENFGLRFTTASHGALIIAVIPLGTELADSWRKGRLPRGMVLAGLFLAFIGLTFLVGSEQGGEASLKGDLLMLGAVLCWIGYTLLLDHLAGRYPNLLLTWWLMAVGTLTLAPAALVESILNPWGPPSLWASGGVLFLGIFCSALAYLAWNRAVPALGVTASNSLIYGIPLVGVLTGILTLGEPFTLRLLFGAILIVGGVLLAGIHSRR